MMHNYFKLWCNTRSCLITMSSKRLQTVVPLACHMAMCKHTPYLTTDVTLPLNCLKLTIYLLTLSSLLKIVVVVQSCFCWFLFFDFLSLYILLKLVLLVFIYFRLFVILTFRTQDPRYIVFIFNTVCILLYMQAPDGAIAFPLSKPGYASRSIF